MLSYRHGFHAGNFADVFKHSLLCLLVQAQLRKEKPFFYLDTHSGAGRYDLSSTMAVKNREFDGGIGRLALRHDVPKAIQFYLDSVRAVNANLSIDTYPGSPLIVRHFIRGCDRMALCELHPRDSQLLEHEFSADKQVLVHSVDGYQGLKAFLPPIQRRGLVLIDPPYELKDERSRLLSALTAAYRRWPTGVYAVWYPIQEKNAVDWFHRQLVRSGIRNILATELRIYDEDVPLRLNGTGMVIINPPWQMDEQLNEIGPWLWQLLSIKGQGGFRQLCLVPE